MTAMTPRWRRRLTARLLLLQAAWSYERMQGLGLMLALEPWLKRCWGAAGAKEALRRHDGFFNTQPFMAPLVVGMTCALEEEAAEAQGAARRAA
jgi:mannose PTS system EIID component